MSQAQDTELQTLERPDAPSSPPKARRASTSPRTQRTQTSSRQASTARSATTQPATAKRKRSAAPQPASPQTTAIRLNHPAEASAPIPRSQALVVIRPGIMTQVGQWLRRLVMVKRPAPAIAMAQPASSQIKALQRDIANLQKTLDQLLESSRK